MSARLGTGFYFQFSFVILVFSALCSGSNMEMKKRISLELRNRNPAEVCNYTDFIYLFTEETGEGCGLERHDDAENVQRDVEFYL